MPKVSVIVPVFNKEKYLDACLNSLVNQSLNDIEIIVIDDNSSDNSLQIIRKYQQNYKKKIKVLTNSLNLGVGACRNIGITFSMGTYISFIDADDFIHKNMYKDMYEGAITNNFPEVMSTNLYIFDDNKEFNPNLLANRRYKGLKINIKKDSDIIIFESSSCCNKLFRHDIARKTMFLENKNWEDAGFTYAALVSSKNLLRFNNTDYFYRKEVANSRADATLKPHHNILDIFDINTQIENAARKTGSYEYLANNIKLIQIANCFRRIEDILEWNIPNNKKLALAKDLITLIYYKYGDYKECDLGLLDTRADVFLIEQLDDTKDKQISKKEARKIKRRINDNLAH